MRPIHYYGALWKRKIVWFIGIGMANKGKAFVWHSIYGCFGISLKTIRFHFFVEHSYGTTILYMTQKEQFNYIEDCLIKITIHGVVAYSQNIWLVLLWYPILILPSRVLLTSLKSYSHKETSDIHNTNGFYSLI